MPDVEAANAPRWARNIETRIAVMRSALALPLDSSLPNPLAEYAGLVTDVQRLGLALGLVTPDAPAPTSDYRALLRELVTALSAAVPDHERTIGWAVRMADRRYGLADSDPEPLKRLYGAYARAAAALDGEGEGE